MDVRAKNVLIENVPVVQVFSYEKRIVTQSVLSVQGGLKAVVWTDSVQTGIMFIGVALVVVAGTVSNGGVTVIAEIARKTGRFDLSK